MTNPPSALAGDADATSSLDLVTETRVADSISELGVARIVVSHRPETLARADRVYVIDKGVLHLVHDRSSEHRGAGESTAAQ